MRDRIRETKTQFTPNGYAIYACFKGILIAIQQLHKPIKTTRDYFDLQVVPLGLDNKCLYYQV